MRGLLTPGSLRPAAGCCNDSCACCGGGGGHEFDLMAYASTTDDAGGSFATRPDADVVYWIGPSEPLNAEEGDLWLNTATEV